MDFQNLRQCFELNFDNMEQKALLESDQHEGGFDSDFDVMSLYQPKDLPKYGQRVTLGSQDIPEHLKRKKKNKNDYEVAGRQTCQPDFAGQLQEKQEKEDDE